ncbi:MAG: hypothetical protein HYV00_13130 [Deltaproteobacteria bacterium]|nr:hypothetical protein [Deltaproteobacteria bacterium]
MQNIWKLWWVNKAVTELHQSPWQTRYLNFPNGVSLLAHDLTPFNGFLATFLMRWMTIIEAHNFVVVFSFVMGGLTAFLLAYCVTKSYWSSLVAGYMFTFSNYHFAHAPGHLPLVSLEWIPAFVLCWYIFVTKSGFIAAIASALTLFAVLLSSYYYFLHSVFAALVIVVWYGFQKKDVLFLFRRNYLIPLAVFLVGIISTAGPLIVAFLLLHMSDPFGGGHSPSEFSLDLLALFVPGGQWRFGELTQFHWSRVPGNTSESSAYVGFSAMLVVAYVWMNRKHPGTREVGLWLWMLVFFALMSLGPTLHIWGYRLSFIALPYRLFRDILPLKLSGVPARMAVMTILSASIICAMGLKILFQESRGKRALAAVLVALFVLEHLPRAMSASQIPIPEYVRVLKDLPEEGAVMDGTTDRRLMLYHQTIHEKPIPFPYADRIPKSLYGKTRKLKEMVRFRQYTVLCRDYNVRYLVVEAGMESPANEPPVKMMYRDSKVQLYDLGHGCGKGRL